MEKSSTTLAALKFTMNEIQNLGAEIKVFDIAKLNLPIYKPSQLSKKSASGLKKMFDEFHSANGYVFASPEYHGSVSGAFKNTLDYFEYLSGYKPPYLQDKPAGCIAVGGGEFSGVTTLQTMINIVNNFRGTSPSKNVVIAPVSKHIDLRKNWFSDIAEKRLTQLARDIYKLSVKLSI